MDSETQNSGIGTNWLSRERVAAVPGPSQEAPLLTHEPRNYMAVAIKKDNGPEGAPRGWTGAAEVAWNTASPVLGLFLTMYR